MESSPDLLSLASLPLLVETCYRHYAPPYVDGVAASGAVTVNHDWEEGKSREWFIDWQRWGGQLVQAGVVLRDRRIVRQGWRILGWGFSRQGPHGDFPGSSGAPLNTTSFFVEAAARALLLQQLSGIRKYAKHIAHYKPKLHAAARWMIRADVAAGGESANRPFTHRYWVMAAALGQAAALLNDPAVEQAAAEYARNGLRLQTPDGVNPERGGYDVRYQAMGALFAARYYAVCTDPDLRMSVRTMLHRALSWETDRIDARGNVNTTGSTRVGRERDREGVTKTVDYRQLVEVLACGNAVTGEVAFKRTARRIARLRGWTLPLAADGKGNGRTTLPGRKSPKGAAKKDPSYSFVFVCQSGEFEVKALLLAASLRRSLRDPVELIAALPVPESAWGRPSDTTLRLLKEMQVRTVPIHNRVDPTFSHANKIDCLNVQVSTDWLIFMDSDMLCLRDFRGEERLQGPFSAKLVDHQTFTKDVRDWRAAYAAAGVSPPTLEAPSTVSQDYGLPYFNSGFVVVEPGSKLGHAWLNCCRKIRADDSLPEMRLTSDQIGLAVAVRALRLPFCCLDERFNYPAHVKPLVGRYPPFFVHYHWPNVVEREPILREHVRQTVKTFPGIAKVMGEHPQWAALRNPKSRLGRRFGLPGRRKRNTGPNLIITGISRSGTSYLCNLLHRYSNCVVLNEPAEVFAPLRNEPVPWSIPVFYRQVRSDILFGRKIVNKLQHGEITQDTALHEQRRTYLPTVDGPDFVLGMKNNMAFMTNLNRLRRVMPDARIVICVRNPFDTIASWKCSFEHLRQADVASRPVGHPGDPWWPAHHALSLNRIAGMADLARRRATLWQFLAERVLDQLDRIVLVRYAELVTRPRAVLDAILKGFRRGRPRTPICPSQVRSRRGALDEADLLAIQAICTQSAAELGVLESSIA